jgi:hypothetical protein
MSNFNAIASKVSPRSVSVSKTTRNVLFAVTGFSAVMIAKAELDK